MNQLPETKATARGALDPSFGFGGLVLLPKNVFACASLPSNKLLTASKEDHGLPMKLTRLTEFGRLDDSFGIGGVAEIPHSTGNFFPRQLHALKKGGYLALGPFSGPAASDLYVMRLLEAGQVDLSFGAGGKVKLEAAKLFGADFVFFGSSKLAVSEMDAKIYVSSNIYSNTAQTTVVIRLNEDGSLDTSFNGGHVTLEQPIGNRRVRNECLAVHGEGVLIGGAYLSGVDSYGDAFIIRYDRDGKIDLLFGDRGTVIIANGADGRQSLLTSITVRANEGVVASGRSFRGSNFEGVLIVLNASGAINPVFNSGKPLYPAFLQNLLFSECALLHQDRIIVMGVGEFNFLMVACYNFDGSLDRTFGGGYGRVVLRDAQTSGFRDSLLTTDNKIVSLGTNATFDFAVRYLG